MRTMWTYCLVGMPKTRLPVEEKIAFGDFIYDTQKRTRDGCVEVLAVGFGMGTVFDDAHFRVPPGARKIGPVLATLSYDFDLDRPGTGNASGTEGAETRLDALLKTFDRFVEGPTGEVVGWMAHEYEPFPHAHPLIRCDDGRIRQVLTEPDPARHLSGLGYRPETAPVAIPGIVDVSLIREEAGRFRLSADDLLRRYALEGMRVDVLPSA